MDVEFYEGREQSLVKHLILRKYLERFAFIVGSRWEVLTYVDCFSGPWQVRSQAYEDSSFAIALSELRKAKTALAARSRIVKLRCFFLEETRDAYLKLRDYAAGVTDASVETRNARLEDSIPEITNFVRSGGRKAFSFIFIDPTGWTGFDMRTIAPLLRLKPGEVLINFMTGHIRRFLESPQEETQESFTRLFGSNAFRERIQGLATADREDAAVAEYMRNAQAVGGFDFACSAVVLHPLIARTHFHLIYLTRDRKGVEVFKEAEKKAMEAQEAARAEAQQRARVARCGQAELFASGEMHDGSYYQALRKRYLAMARGSVLNEVQSRQPVLYDDVWTLALKLPTIWESDLKAWISEWIADGKLRVSGLKPTQRVPRRGENHFLIWK